MATIGPVSLEEARDVVADRLLTLEVDPPRASLRPRLRRRPAAGARPHVPRRLRAGPGRAHVSAASRTKTRCCSTSEMRAPLARRRSPSRKTAARTERLLLRLAVGAATERLWLSYPRLDIAESRPRVP